MCMCVEQKQFSLFHIELSNKVTSSHSCGVILGRKPYSFPHYREASGLIHPSIPDITQQFLDWKEAHMLFKDGLCG